MRFLPVALLGLASIAVAEINSWNDVVGDMPQCTKTCLNDLYSSAGLEDKCGSPDEATLNCLCGADSLSKIQDSASDLSSCIQDGCDRNELSDAVTQTKDLHGRFTNTLSQCANEGSTNGATSAVPGLNAMLASGALLLAGAAL